MAKIDQGKLDKRFYAKLAGWSFALFLLCAVCLLFSQFPDDTPGAVKYGMTILMLVLTFVFIGFRAFAGRPMDKEEVIDDTQLSPPSQSVLKPDDVSD